MTSLRSGFNGGSTIYGVHTLVKHNPAWIYGLGKCCLSRLTILAVADEEFYFHIFMPLFSKHDLMTTIIIATDHDNN